jgi:cytochrome c1
MCLSIFGVEANELKLEKADVQNDLPSLSRGAETVATVCNGCHSLKYIRYRDLLRLGIANKSVDDWRGAKPLESPMLSSMAPEVEQQSFGIVPPDLSLITSAREGGADYVYSFLTGFYTNSQGVMDNHFFNNTKMMDVLNIAGSAAPAERAEAQKKAHDVVSFLVWAADPAAQKRHALGRYVIGYLVLLTILLYFWKRRIWSRLD